MRVCPQCRAEYAVDMSFCLQDGATLIDSNLLLKSEKNYSEEIVALLKDSLPQTVAALTQVSPQQQSNLPATVISSAENQSVPIMPQYQSATTGRKSNVGLVIGIVIGGFLLVGAAIGGIALFAISHSSDDSALVVSNKPVANRTVDSRTPTPTKSVFADDESPSSTPKNLTNISKVVSGGVVNSKATNLVQPQYPPAARAVRASGVVNVQVTIDESGNVISASAVSGHPLLRASAEQAARASKFSPTLLSGQTLRVTGIIVYNFVPD